MQKKTLKFRDHLAKLVLSGEKTSTWRLFDEKNLAEGDEVELINKDSGERFADATITDVREKELGKIEASDFDGHESFASEEEMYQTYRSYYGDMVGPSTIVKIIKFRIV